MAQMDADRRQWSQKVVFSSISVQIFICICTITLLVESSATTSRPPHAMQPSGAVSPHLTAIAQGSYCASYQAPGTSLAYVSYTHAFVLIVHAPLQTSAILFPLASVPSVGVMVF